MESVQEREMFVNLPVKDLSKTIDFFKQLGFEFNPQFSDENATCMVIGKYNFAMLLTEPFFKGFTPHHEIADAARSKEVLVAVSLESREAVDNMMKQAIAAGGKEYRPRQDLGWMYGCAFQDIDGHVWEPFYMDMNAMPDPMKKTD